MALDVTALQTNILQTMKDAAKSKDGDSAQAVLAHGLAQAIHQYVSGAAVRGLAVDILKGNPANQIADGKLS